MNNYKLAYFFIIVLSIFSSNIILAKYKIVEIQRYLLSDKYQIGFCDRDKNACNNVNQFYWVDNNSNITANNFYFGIREKDNPNVWFSIKNSKNKTTGSFARSQFERVAIWYLDVINETSLPTECIANSKINVNAIFNSYGDDAPAIDETEVICG